MDRTDDDLQRNALGFHIPGRYDRIEDIIHCHLQPEPSNAIRNAVRDYAFEHHLSFYDIENHTGFLRNLIVRTFTKGEVMVILSVSENNELAIEALMQWMDKRFPEITSLHYVVNWKKNDTLFDQDIVTYRGRGYIVEEMEDLQFKISPKSFFQTNPYQGLKLYQTAREMADLQGHETVYDLYTGTGSIALFIARYCQSVVGIEEVEVAIEDAEL